MTSLRTEIVDMWHKGHTYHEIAMSLHCSRSTVAGHIYRHRAGIGSSVPRPPRPITPRKDRRERKRTRGPNRATDPATYEIVKAIEGSTLYDAEIADKAGVAVKTLRTWRNGTRTGRKFLLECVREALIATE